MFIITKNSKKYVAMLTKQINYNKKLNLYSLPNKKTFKYFY